MRAPVLVLLLLAPMAAAGGSAAPLGDLIVTLAPGAAPDPLPTGAIPLLAIEGYVLPDATAADAARLARDPRVERLDWAKPLEFHAGPTLPASAHQGLSRIDGSYTGRGVTIAVLDSGIDQTHPDLAGRVTTNVRLVEGRFVPSLGDADGHGTHVAGIVAASGAASQGRWRGVAPDAELVGIDISGRFTTASALLAYDWLLANHARLGIDAVVNAWGRVPDGDSFDARDPVIRAIDRLVAAGVVVLFSASNRGPEPGSISVEAQDPYVITVGATDASGILMRYSSRGPVSGSAAWTKPDLIAPGEMVVGLRSAQANARAEDPDVYHAVYSGTSQAVPHVAGVVAQMLEARPDLSPAEVARALRASAIDLAEPGPDDATGYGLLDAHDALRIARDLAPDRGNVLIVGGSNRHQDVADLVATPQRGLLDLVSRPDVVWETLFPVKLGATHLRASVRAEAGETLDVELVRAGKVHRDGEVASPEPGIWTLRARGTLPVATRAIATIDLQMPAQPDRALQLDGRGAVAMPVFQDDEPPVTEWLWLPLGIWAVSGATLAYAIMPRRPRDK